MEECWQRSGAAGLDYQERGLSALRSSGRAICYLGILPSMLLLALPRSFDYFLKRERGRRVELGTSGF